MYMTSIVLLTWSADGDVATGEIGDILFEWHTADKSVAPQAIQPCTDRIYYLLDLHCDFAGGG